VSAPSTVLAFDFGERYLGVAIGNTITGVAQPIDLIEATEVDKRFAAVEALIKAWQPAHLVVGLPLSMDGAEHAMTARCRRFARQLEGRFRLPVFLVDERLTSASAEESLRQAGKGGRKHKHLAHSLSAQIILQAWLDDPQQRASVPDQPRHDNPAGS
jgi:putative Holliday junction resolvase